MSFFYDATRNVYRIISVGGTKVSAWEIGEDKMLDSEKRQIKDGQGEKQH